MTRLSLSVWNAWIAGRPVFIPKLERFFPDQTCLRAVRIVEPGELYCWMRAGDDSPVCRQEALIARMERNSSGSVTAASPAHEL